MAELKTKATNASVAAYLAAIGDEERRADCEAIAKLMHRITRQEPRMWGPSIVGFGSYRYQYASGHSGEYCQTGFSSRKKEISVYLLAASGRQEELLARLGKHRMGVGCLYIRRVSEIDLGVLEALISASFAELGRRWPDASTSR